MRTLLGLAFLGVALYQPAAPAAGGEGKGPVVKLGKLASQAPAAWKQEKPASRFRLYQFRLPRAEKDKADAELTVFFFGEGSGGTAEANVKRWKSMFQAPAGKSLDDVSKVETFKVSGAEVTYLDVQGTYLEKFPPFAPNPKTIRRPQYRLLGAVVECEGGPYFIRLTGPARTVAQHKNEFDRWLKAFK
jgi:hypothetical protein